MSSGQKVIKIVAIIFAIIIIVNILGALIFGASIFLGISKFTETTVNDAEELITDNNNSSEVKANFSEMYSNIDTIDIDINISNLVIKQGTEFKVEAFNVPNNFSSKAIGRTLKIKENGNRNLFKDYEMAKIVIEVPQNTTLNKINVETDIGSILIENVKTNEFDFDSGVGATIIRNVESNRTDINTGSGEIKIEKSKLNNLDFEAGVGKVKLEAEITGISKIEAGVGEINIRLLGNKEDYKINTKTGIGNISIDNKKYTNNSSFGNGTNIIRITGGMGNVNITF